MRMSRFVGLGLIAVLGGVGCGPMYGPGAAAPTSPQMQAEPINQSGPPGGGADLGYGYQDQQAQDPINAGDPQPADGYANQVETGEAAPADPYVEPSVDPNSSGYVMGNVNDQEINNTLAPYGEWGSDPDYGRVWRPHATVVGANFTPYESCGTWVYTEYGWTFQACEDWSWGWLPFHYGAWDWIGGGWAWVPDYTWGPGWVDWRTGGGYVGWRPSRPRLRDHRDRGNNRPDRYVRDHRDRSRDWRFVRDHELANRRINASHHADAMRVTSDVSRPNIRPTGPRANVANVMGSRLKGRVATVSPNNHRYRPSNGNPSYRAPYRRNQPSYGSYSRPDRSTFDRYQRPNNNTYQRPYSPLRNDQRYQPRPNDQRYQPQPDRSAPSRTYRDPYRPQQNNYQRPQPNNYSRPQPNNNYSRPQQNNYSRPSQPSNYSRPSNSGGGSSYKSGSSNSGGSSRSSNSGGSSRSGGGGGGGGGSRGGGKK